jgi:hypothetical protein
MLFKPKRNYYYLVAGLPDILLDEGKIKSSLTELKTEFQNDLHSEDFSLVQLLFLKHDNNNLLGLIQKSDRVFDENGSFPPSLLEDQIKEIIGVLPSYMNAFISQMQSDEQINNTATPELLLEELFYNYLLSVENEFLQSWFLLQYRMNNLIAAFNAKHHGYQLEEQLVGNDDFVESLQRSNARDFGLTQEFPETDLVLVALENKDLLAREKALDLIRWNWIDEKVFFHYFTIERIIAFMLQFEMAERWLKLDQETGRMMFNTMLEKLNNSYTLPETFSLQYRAAK